MVDFTSTQGRYLSFIHAYTSLHGRPPAESEIAAAMCVSPPSVNQMVRTLEKKGLILRQPGVSRSIQVLVPEDEIPPWRKGGGKSKRPQPASKRTKPQPTAPASPPTNLYVLAVYLMGGPVSEKVANKEISRVIEVRGDQTLQQLHEAIFQAYDRWDEHLYEFQFGRRPFDPDGPNYGLPTGKKRNHSSKSVGRNRRNRYAILSLGETKNGPLGHLIFNILQGTEWSTTNSRTVLGRRVLNGHALAGQAAIRRKPLAICAT